jgi:predicted DNA-binding helix-hairpin-helix protein
VSLLKILITNFCIYDCQYCVNRVSSDVPRARFSVQEVVDLTLDFYRRNYVEGLFLSSGIIQSADYTTEQMVEVARRLRIDHKFGGYIHLKIIPGAAPPLVEAAGIASARISSCRRRPTSRDWRRTRRATRSRGRWRSCANTSRRRRTIGGRCIIRGRSRRRVRRRR